MKVQRLTVETMEDILIEDNGLYKVMYNPRKLYVYINIEYNTDTSTEHLKKDEDIVRATDINETVES